MGTELPGSKILVVDDERLVRWSLRQKCEEWGLRTAESKINSAPRQAVASILSSQEPICGDVPTL
jgi:CheY-like chemotaxis protein